jgi:hypothetical protein
MMVVTSSGSGVNFSNILRKKLPRINGLPLVVVNSGGTQHCVELHTLPTEQVAQNCAKRA